MNQLLWLMSKILLLMLRAAIHVGLELLGCAVRLFYWSVRTYGWGKVTSFLMALAGSIWLHAQFGRLSSSSASLVTVSIGTAALWGALLGGALWVTHQWQGWSTTRQHSPNPAYFPDPPIGIINAERFEGTSYVAEGSELWERLVDRATLQQAWQRVLLRGGGPGPDGVTVEAFALDVERNLRRLEAQLRSGLYRPRPPRWVEIPKPGGGTRRLGVLCVQDRVAQQAALSVLMAQWDGRFAPCSYAYRPGRSAQQAVAAVERALAAGRVWVVDADIGSFFDSVPHAPLFALIEEWLPDVRVRRLVQLCISTAAPTPGQGLTQGAPLSPLLANLYLHRFDCTLSQMGHQLIRYADDFVILCATRPQAEQALQTAQRLLEGLGLRLNEEKTRIVHRDEGFTFLGWTFNSEGKRPSEQAVESLQGRLASASDEPTRRQILAGWQGYFGEEAATQILARLDVGAPVAFDTPAEAQDEMPWWADMEDEDSVPLHGGVPASALGLYRRHFMGRPDVFARFWQKDGRSGYLPVRRLPTDQELQEHLAGQTILGTYLLLPDNNTRALVLDIDGPDCSEAGRTAAFTVAQRLVEALHHQGIEPLWVDSGGKGFHLWLCLSQPASAQEVRQWANRWLDRFRPLPEGVLVEIFPKQDRLTVSTLGALIRLPFGRHPQTGRWSRLLSTEGEAAQDLWATLAAAPLVDPQMLLEINPTIRSDAVPEPPEAIAPVVQGCALLAALVKKAAQTRHLRHTERLALLYTLGHLGEEGRNYLHQVMALCSNYDPRITERWLRRLEEGHRSIRCRTLQEWLKDHLPGMSCSCPPKRANPSPLDLLRQAHKPQPEPPATPSDDVAGAWDDVAEEMFGEVLAEQDDQRG